LGPLGRTSKPLPGLSQGGVEELHQFPNRGRVADEMGWAALGGEEHFVGVDAELGVDGADEVFGGEDAGVGGVAFAVGGADDDAAGGAAAGHQDGHGVGPVVAARLVLAGEGADGGGAPEFAEGDDEGAFQQAVVRQVADERGHGVVPFRQPFAAGTEDVGVMVPAAVIDGDEGDAGLDEAAGEEGSLAETVAAVGGADFFGLAVDVERGLGLFGGDEVVPLAVVRVKAADGVAGGGVVVALDFVHELFEVSAAAEAPLGEAAGEGDVADAEVRVVRVAVNDEGGVFGPQEIRAAGAGHRRDGEIRGEAVVLAELVGGDASHAGMKADERPAADRNSRGGPGHHVVVAGSVVPLVVADGADDGELVEARRQLRHVLAELDAGDFRRDGGEVAADFGGGIGFGIEGLEMRGTAVHPNEDAAFGLGFDGVFARFRIGICGLSPEAESTDQAAAEE